METNPTIENLLTRGVENIIPDRNQLASFIEKKKIRLYLGIDPTGGRLHLGHTINLLKFQEFAEMGHEAILIIGTGTVLVGDPSLRNEARKRITKKEVKDNIKTWKKQAGKILDFSKIKVKHNGDWILKLKYEDIVNIASNVTATHLFQRDNFQKRIERGDAVWYHETMYPLMQGYDSVVLDVDLEIGGSDQLFNMLVGRSLQKKMNNKEKYVLTSPMILGTDGKQMSKTSGNCIWLEDSPKEIFGKIMSMPDEFVFDYFELVTRVSLEEIKKMKESGVNPRDLKVKLGKEIVRMYHSEKEAEKAEEGFERVHKEKQVPRIIEDLNINIFNDVEIRQGVDIKNLLVKSELAFSMSEAKRLVEQGGVKIDGQVEKDWRKEIKIKPGMIIQVGKRRFVKIK